MGKEHCCPYNVDDALESGYWLRRNRERSTCTGHDIVDVGRGKDLMVVEEVTEFS
jgi:hypothetical protein